MEFIIEKNIPLPADTETEAMPIPEKKMGRLPINPETGLNTRQEKFVEAAINTDRKDMADKVVEIYKSEGTTITRESAHARSAELRKNSKVMAILEQHAEEAEQGIVDIAKYATTLGKMGGKEGAAYANVGLSAHDKILDRVHGKAKQSIDVTTRSVTINMDLTQSLPEEA